MGEPVIRIESGQTAQAFEELTNSGDNMRFSASFSPLSSAAGREPVIAPYGLVTGGAITPTATSNQVSVAALTAMGPGITGAGVTGMVSVASGTVMVTRGTGSNVCSITSVTVTAAGALAAVAGTAAATFSETRGAAGGPPFIPVGSIEIGQVRTSAIAAAVVASGDIYQIPGLTQERSDFPTYNVLSVSGEVEFVQALPLIHTGGVPKKVYMSGYTPLFQQLSKTADWVPAEATYSISSTDTYDGPVGSSSSTLNQATFTVILPNGVSESFLQLRGQNLWFEFRPDRDASFPKQLTQGIFGVSRTFPAGGGARVATCTVTPQEASRDVLS